MADKIDMTLPDSFHRLKRTVLAYAAALIVIGLGVPAARETVPILGIPLDVPIDTVRILLLIAMCWYAVGFYLEVRTAQLLNCQLLAHDNTKGFEGRIEKTAEALSMHERRLASVSDQVLNAVEELHQVAQRAASAREEYPTQIQDYLRSRLVDLQQSPGMSDRLNPLLDREAAVAKAWARDISQLVSDALHRSARRDSWLSWTFGEELKEVRGLTAETLAQTESFRRDVSRISRDVVGARQFSFWAWEVGGAGLTFVAAIIIGFPGIRAFAVAAAQLLSLYGPGV